MTQVSKQSLFALSCFWALATPQLSAAEYPYLYRSAYFLGRGDTGIALADGEDALFYNPAGLASGTGLFKKLVLASPSLEVSKGTRDLVKQIALQESDFVTSLRNQEGVVQHAGLNQFSGLILRRAALGVFVHDSTTALLYKDPEKGSLESVNAASISDAGVVFSLAQNFGPQWKVGITNKIFKRNQVAFYANATDSDKVKNLAANNAITMLGTGTGIDLGLMYTAAERHHFAWGLTLQDVGNTTLIPDQATTLKHGERPLKNIKQTLNSGVAFAPGTLSSNFKLLADLRDLLGATGQSSFKRLHLGSELSMKDIIGFCAGLNQGYPTFGAYLDLHFFRVDLGTYTEEVGEKAGSRPDNRYFFKLSMGL